MDTYEKKYKEALEKARKELQVCGSLDCDAARQVFRLFPELKESEDERIRKEIIDFIDTTTIYSDERRNRWFFWLEKQGEKLPVGFYYVNSEGKKFYSDTFKYGDVTLHVEKQGEIDNCPLECSTNTVMTDSTKNQVKPKFKVGDFILNDYCIGKVIEVTNDAYLLDSGQGIPFSCEHNAHLWTLEDANDGDVLVGKIDGDNYILIFKQVKDGWVETYGHYYDSVDRFCVPSQLFCRDYQGTFIPATKEKCDLLFQKMKEAGYEWDAEKKELKIKLKEPDGCDDNIKWSDTDKLLMRLDKIVDCNIDQLKCLNNIFDKLNEII